MQNPNMFPSHSTSAKGKWFVSGLIIATVGLSLQ
jgi:hypothetical protein